MSNQRRLRGGLLRAFTASLILFLCGWLGLYLDSVYQRRKAERFLSDLRSFPFASARFNDVRDLVARHGGVSTQGSPPHFPPACTARGCTFMVEIRHPLAAFVGRQNSELLYSSLPYFGIRPWIVYSDFEVVGDRLESSTTQIAQLRRGQLGTYEGLLPIMYQVQIDRHLDMNIGNAGYAVGPPDGIEGPPQEVWLAWVPLTNDAPVSRALDLDLRCFTAVFRGCTGYQELAPSAWTDNHANRKN